MGRINVLDQNIASKIAAGEVVDRPSSVVKELVENSIDAKSTAITVEIKNGGILFIRVTDNGIGIEHEDTVIAFERHATSKISDVDDLNKIATLGFRGEALASISAVAQVELITKTHNSMTGTLVEMNGGILQKQEEIGCPNGTTIVVKNLFFNTPARLKFLKKDSTEAGLISDLIERLTLTHPEISFKLINNNQTIIHTPGNGDTLTTILSVFGKDLAKGMIPVNYESNGISVSGYIGKPEVSRANRNYQCIFVNRRFIKNRIISSALDFAYKTLVMVNRYPAGVLYISLDPSHVDVNVHPTKMEVRFSDEEKVYNVIVEAVTSSLKNNVLIPQIILTENKVTSDEVNETNKAIEKVEWLFPSDSSIVKEAHQEYKAAVPVKAAPQKSVQHYKQHENEIISLKEIEQHEVSIKKSYKIIGQIFSTYIIVEMEDKMFVIDQHAAHERIKFNSLKKKYQDNDVMSQNLLDPIVVDLSFNEYKKVEENIELFFEIGFELEPFGENTFIIRSVPYVLGQNMAKDFMVEVIDTLSSKRISSVVDLREEVLYSMACKSAVKANMNLSPQEIHSLVEEVLGLEDAFTCPHGRPIIISISKYELEKMFKRIQ